MSLQVGKISRYDAKSNRIWLEPVLEYPFDFKKKIDEDASSVQYDPSPYQEDGSLEVKYVHYGKQYISGAWFMLIQWIDGLQVYKTANIQTSCAGAFKFLVLSYSVSWQSVKALILIESSKNFFF